MLAIAILATGTTLSHSVIAQEEPQLDEGILQRLDLHPIRLERIQSDIVDGLNQVHGLLDILPEEYGAA